MGLIRQQTTRWVFGGMVLAVACSSSSTPPPAAGDSGASIDGGGVGGDAGSALDGGGVSGWSAATAVDSVITGATSSVPAVAIDPAGNVVVAWNQSDGTKPRVWANRYVVASSAWGGAVPISNDAGNSTSSVQVATDVGGNVVAVWSQDLRIWANRWSADAGAWSTAERVELASGSTNFGPKIAVDREGNATVVWSQNSTGQIANPEHVWANRWSIASGTWGDAGRLESDSVSAKYASVAACGSGDVVAAWIHSALLRPNVYANRWASGAWQGAVRVDGEDGGTAGGPPGVGCDDGGVALVFWVQSAGGFANRFVGGAWGDAGMVSPASDAGTEAAPTVAVDWAGNAVAAWTEVVGSDSIIRGARYNAAAGTWVGATLDNASAGMAYSPSVGIDADGGATVVWYQMESGASVNSVWLNHAAAAAGDWVGASVLAVHGSGAAYPRVAVNASGRAAVAWQVQSQSTDGGPFIWVNIYK
ncbi:MAG: hypothetical protein HYY84_08535 [Deltaproteobacteria bacterium]|nr:hypothetical protein [Deltaproteobacteria bacterium]